MTTQVLELVKTQTVLRVVSEERVYFVVVDDKGKMNAFYDERCTSSAGLWHWQEKEMQNVVKEYFNAHCENGETVLR